MRLLPPDLADGGNCAGIRGNNGGSVNDRAGSEIMHDIVHYLTVFASMSSFSSSFSHVVGSLGRFWWRTTPP